MINGKLVRNCVIGCWAVVVTKVDVTAHCTRDLRNSEIRFGIEISETKPWHSELFLELRNSEKFGILKELVHGRLPERLAKSSNAGRLQHTNFTMFRYADDASKLR